MSILPTGSAKQIQNRFSKFRYKKEILLILLVSYLHCLSVARC